jgi:crotonobetainyl-CoA:carnitine CoA-transferase CaiB-like acyl-CoA transferase
MLDGTRVADLSLNITGPSAARILVDFGGDVARVEPAADIGDDLATPRQAVFLERLIHPAKPLPYGCGSSLAGDRA